MLMPLCWCPYVDAFKLMPLLSWCPLVDALKLMLFLSRVANETQEMSEPLVVIFSRVLLTAHLSLPSKEITLFESKRAPLPKANAIRLRTSKYTSIPSRRVAPVKFSLGNIFGIYQCLFWNRSIYPGLQEPRKGIHGIRMLVRLDMSFLQRRSTIHVL